VYALAIGINETSHLPLTQPMTYLVMSNHFSRRDERYQFFDSRSFNATLSST
jgi:hypothetical protein